MDYIPFSTARRDRRPVGLMLFGLAVVVGVQIGWIITLQRELESSYRQMDRAVAITKDTMVTLALYRQRLDAGR